MTCGGSSGGDKYMNLYHHDVDPSASVVPNAEVFGDAPYLGCFSVEANKDVLSEEWTYDDMTNEVQKRCMTWQNKCGTCAVLSSASFRSMQSL